jgi:hypothetical protein
MLTKINYDLNWFTIMEKQLEEQRQEIVFHN